MSIFGERVKQVLDYKQFNISAFEKKINISQGYLHKIFKKDDLNYKVIDFICEIFPDINKQWLINGGGEMINENIKFVTLEDIRICVFNEVSFFCLKIGMKEHDYYRDMNKDIFLLKLSVLRSINIAFKIDIVEFCKEAYNNQLKAKNHDIEDIDFSTFSPYKKKETIIVSEPAAEYGVKKAVKEINKGVPVYNLEFSAGLLPFGGADIDLENNILGYMNFPDLKGADAIVKVKGDSMQGYIENGDWIAIKKVSADIINFGHAYAILTTSELPLIKFIRKGSNTNSVLLRSNNPEFEDFEILKSQISQLFMIVDKIQIRGLAN